MISKPHWFLTSLATLAVAAAQEDPPKPVTIITAERKALPSSLDLTGSITARRISQLSARTSGLIRKLNIDAGSPAKAGQVLMELDDELATLALERISVEAEQAELQLNDARRLDEEARRLTETGAFPQSEALTRANAVKLADSAIRLSAVAAKEQQAIVDRHHLIAPFDGVISRKLAEEGEWVQTGTPVAELVETGSLRMDVQAPQEYAALLSENPALTITLDAHPATPLTGKIATIVPIQNAIARTFLARIEFEDTENIATPGMSGRVSFRFNGPSDILQIPRDSIVRLPDGTAKVWTIVPDSSPPTVRSQTVTLGDSLTETIEVLSGLDAGARVIMRGNENLREGQAVEILPSPPAR